MALSAEEKERRKAERRTRDAAHRKRRKLRDAAEQAGLAEIDATGLLERMKAAHKASEMIMENRRAAFRDAARKIDEIRAELAVTEAALDVEYAAFRAVEISLWAEKNAAEKALDARLDHQFPDLVGSAKWSAACWDSSKVPGEPS